MTDRRVTDAELVELAHKSAELLVTEILVAEIRRLRAENEALRRDAERWRWLRAVTSTNLAVSIFVNDERLGYENPEPGMAVRLIYWPSTPVGSDDMIGDSLDVIADAAMAQEQEGG